MIRVRPMIPGRFIRAMNSRPRSVRSFAAILPLIAPLLACGDDPGGPTDDRDDLQEIPVLWADVTLGSGGFSDFTCGLSTDGAAYCWGVNDSGQLGYGDERPVGVPRPVRGGLSFGAIEAGWRHTCPLDLSGAAHCWGASSIEESNSGTGPRTPAPVPGGRTFEAIAARNFQTCGLDAEGAAWCWTGSNAEPVALPGGDRFSMISLGSNYGCGVRLDGVGVCWGDNSGFALGNGTQDDSDEPVPVAGDIEFVSLSSGNESSCGLDLDGVVYCWGEIRHYAPVSQPPAGGPTPTAVSTSERFVQVTVGSRHTCALRADGAAFCWGEGSQGQLGNGSSEFGTNVPVAVEGGIVFDALAAGGVNTCGLTAAGELWCWGSDSAGQLGRGTDVVAGDLGGFSAVPVRVLNPRG